MKQFIYRGPATNLGRFGLVRKRDVLLLTDAEAEAIGLTRRFRRLDFSHYNDSRVIAEFTKQFVYFV